MKKPLFLTTLLLLTLLVVVDILHATVVSQPVVATMMAYKVTSNSASLAAYVATDYYSTQTTGLTGEAYIEWGTDANMVTGVNKEGMYTKTFTPGTGVNIDAFLTGLTPSTNYYYRGVFKSSSRTTYGAIYSFRTGTASTGGGGTTVTCPRYPWNIFKFGRKCPTCFDPSPDGNEAEGNWIDARFPSGVTVAFVLPTPPAGSSGGTITVSRERSWNSAGAGATIQGAFSKCPGDLTGIGVPYREKYKTNNPCIPPERASGGRWTSDESLGDTFSSATLCYLPSPGPWYYNILLTYTDCPPELGTCGPVMQWNHI